MTTLEKQDYVFDVDIEKTREYYRTHALCSCGCCRNYSVQVRNQLPMLAEFLDEFGVDLARPDEAGSMETENCVEYLSVDYTVCGRIRQMGAYEIDLHDQQFVSIVVSDGFVSPNEQDGDYFTLSVMQIKLPWVLEEPFPAPKRKKNLLKRFLGKSQT